MKKGMIKLYVGYAIAILGWLLALLQFAQTNIDSLPF